MQIKASGRAASPGGSSARAPSAEDLAADAACQAWLREIDRRIRGFGAAPIIVTQIRGDARNLGGINRVVYDVTSKPPGTIEWG